jgi:hypothetical protein
MTLIAWNVTGPILKNGAIGTEQACCCGDTASTVTGCCSSGVAKVVPSSVSVTLTLGARYDGTYCTQAEAEALINGTYVLPFVDLGFTTLATYSLTLSNGMTVELVWYCNANPSMFLAVRWCDIAADCYRRAFFDFYCDKVPSTTFGRTGPTLCSITEGDTSSIGGDTIGVGQLLVLVGGIFSCSGFGSNDRYPVTVSMVPAW